MRACCCGNVFDEKYPTYRLTQRPCQCDEPCARTASRDRLRVPPTDLRQPADPDRRRLGLPGMTDLERAILPKSQHSRYT